MLRCSTTEISGTAGRPTKISFRKLNRFNIAHVRCESQCGTDDDGIWSGHDACRPLHMSLGQRLSLVQRSCLTVPQAERKSAHPSTVADHIPFDGSLGAVESD